ncbi:hypothetical protein B0H12DRAFT_380352 [Mycena haematopus]|nr:hypothetical protein B0H12DRAFT_380352 [Mycena haematopus]
MRRVHWTVDGSVNIRHIHLLGAANVPRDDEFHFRNRVKASVDNWHNYPQRRLTRKLEGRTQMSEWGANGSERYSGGPACGRPRKYGCFDGRSVHLVRALGHSDLLGNAAFKLAGFHLNRTH